MITQNPPVEVQELERGVRVMSATAGTGAIARIVVDGGVITPPNDAMQQALYSRSPDSVLNHLRKVLKSGSDRFMDQYYVGYGHKSIGDCGSLTVYFEGSISMLAAKVIQSCQLYNGQEGSTRYMDFDTVPFLNPFRRIPGMEGLADSGDQVMETFRGLYKDARNRVYAHLLEKYASGQDAKQDKVLMNAISARAFDICRGILPAGATTNLSWHGEISVFGEQLPKLKAHPLPEVQEVARALEAVLCFCFPSSFPVSHQDDLEEYYRRMDLEETYHHERICPPFECDHRLNRSMFRKVIKKERHFPLPERYKEGGILEMSFLLDYGSFRDIQRHRSVVQRLPILTMDFGIHEWYINNLRLARMPEYALSTSLQVLQHFMDEVQRTLGTANLPLIVQYFIPMGFQVSCRLTGSLWALAYILETRCSSKVHPTLASLMHQHIKPALGMYVLVDTEEDPLHFNPARGKDVIEEK